MDFCCKRSPKEFERSALEWFWYWSNSTKYQGSRPFWHLELSKLAKVTWTQHGRKSGADEVLPQVDLAPAQMLNFSWAEPITLN